MYSVIMNVLLRHSNNFIFPISFLVWITVRRLRPNKAGYLTYFSMHIGNHPSKTRHSILPRGGESSHLYSKLKFMCF